MPVQIVVSLLPHHRVSRYNVTLLLKDHDQFKQWALTVVDCIERGQAS
jgi:hypothetical protein